MKVKELIDRLSKYDPNKVVSFFSYELDEEFSLCSIEETYNRVEFSVICQKILCPEESEKK